MPDNAQPTKFHASLYVNNLAESVAFYGRIFGIPPTKYFKDYAKFEVEDPGLVLSLEQAKDGQKPGLNHVGIKLADRNALVNWTSDITERGLDFQHIDRVNCCYADQSKIFMNDPDGILFEIYNVNKDIDPAETTDKERATVAIDNLCDVLHGYEHMLPSPFPEHLEFSDGALAKVALRGTLNASVGNDVYFSILKESYRALKADGELIIHMLVSDVEVKDDLPMLPEPASHVRRIPTEDLIWSLVREAGFVGLTAQRLSPHHVFAFKGSHFRELLLVAYKANDSAASEGTVVYKGPFAKIETETGLTFERGARTSVDATTLAFLKTTSYKEFFAFLNNTGSTCSDD